MPVPVPALDAPAPGMMSRCPTLKRFGSERLFAEAIDCHDTPNRAPIAPRVSPDLTIYSVPLPVEAGGAGGCVLAGGGLPDPLGIVSTWPMLIKFTLAMLFACAIAFTVVPNLAAIAPSVSPDCTT